MSDLIRRSIAGLAATTAVVSAAAPLAAQEAPQTFVVTSTTTTAAGRVVEREVLSLQGGGRQAHVRVASGESMFAMPVALAADGEIASASQDRSITCYNMAMNVLAHEAQTQQRGAPAVYVQFLSSVVAIPLGVRATHVDGAARTFALAGTSTGTVNTAGGATPAGVSIDATIGARDGSLQTATFDELTYVGANTNVIGRSTCVLERAAPALRAQAQT